jgi:hypothetical protein
LLSFLTIGAEQGKRLELFGTTIDETSALPWIAAIALLTLGVVWLRIEARYFARVWETVTADMPEARA